MKQKNPIIIQTGKFIGFYITILEVGIYIRINIYDSNDCLFNSYFGEKKKLVKLIQNQFNVEI